MKGYINNTIGIVCLLTIALLVFMEYKNVQNTKSEKAEREMLIHKVDSLTTETQQLEQEYFELHYKYSTCCEAVIDSSGR
jgi:hypothetical protein